MPGMRSSAARTAVFATLALAAVLLAPRLALRAARSQSLRAIARPFAGRQERRAIDRLADSLWVVEQRAAGPVAVNAAGTPTYAVVRHPQSVREVQLVVRPWRQSRRALRLAWGAVLGLLLAFVIRTWMRGERVVEPWPGGRPR